MSHERVAYRLPLPVALIVASLMGCSGSSSSEANPMAGTALEGVEAEAMRAVGSMRGFNQPGNTLISDQFNNRVIEVDGRGDILWSFGLGPNDVSERSAVGVNDAQRVGALTLIAGTGAPAGTEPSCPTGCADNRVFLVTPGGRVVWQYGQFGVTGSDPDELNTPVQATWLPNLHVLISDQGNQRIIEVTLDKKIVWQYGTTGVAGNGPNELNNPNSAELLENGHVLISDESNNRAIEVSHDSTGTILKTFTAGGTVSGVAFASRLEGGHTLLTDSNNNRAVEVDASDAVVWQYVTNLEAGSNAAPQPTRAIRLRNGDTLVSDQFNHRVIRVDHATPAHLLATFGTLDQAGYGTSNANQGLNAPYDAKVVGDYTGLTFPFGGHDD
jgi:hypothetical protein